MLIRKPIRIKACLAAMVGVTCLMLVWVQAVPAQKCKPLLIPGKRSIFQQVITHPGANLYASASISAKLRKRRG